MKNAVKLFVVAALLIVVGISMIVVGLMPPAELRAAEETARNEFSVDYAYSFDELVIWDTYAIADGSIESGEGTYYIAYHQDEDGQIVLFSVYFDNSGEWKREIAKCDFETGTMPMRACFQTRTVASVDDELEEYYEEAVGYAREYMLEYGLNPINSNLHLKYVCDDSADYASAASQTPVAIFGCIVIVLGGALVFVGIRIKRREEYLAALSRQQAEALFATTPDTFAATPTNPTTHEPPQGPEF